MKQFIIAIISLIISVTGIIISFNKFWKICYSIINNQNFIWDMIFFVLGIAMFFIGVTILEKLLPKKES